MSSLICPQSSKSLKNCCLATTRLTAQKAQEPFDKLRYDTTHRSQGDMLTYRACRLLQPMFVARNNLEALNEELVHLHSLPHVQQFTGALAVELPVYHTAAVAAQFRLEATAEDSLVPAWAFWRRNALKLTYWNRAAKEVALVMTSSGSVERVFSVYESLSASSKTWRWRTAAPPV